jgi:DNA-binding NtrC family response regulator
MLLSHPLRTILIVDADGTLTEAAMPALVERGYRVLRASDTSSAWWVLHRTEVDLALVDACVPDARELLDVKATDPDLADVRVVLVSVGASEMQPIPGLIDEVVTPSLH